MHQQERWSSVLYILGESLSPNKVASGMDFSPTVGALLASPPRVHLAVECGASRRLSLKIVPEIAPNITLEICPGDNRAGTLWDRVA